VSLNNVLQCAAHTADVLSDARLFTVLISFNYSYASHQSVLTELRGFL